MLRKKTTPSQEYNLSWLAGIFDGEGSIGMYNTKKTGRIVGVVIVNTDESILRKIEEIYSEHGIYYHRYKRKIYVDKLIKQNKQCFEIVVRRKKEAKKVLELVLPYLASVKKQKALDIIDWVNRTEIKPHVCSYCKKEFTGRKKKYCSLKCWHDFAKGENNPNYRHGKYFQV